LCTFSIQIFRRSENRSIDETEAVASPASAQDKAKSLNPFSSREDNLLKKGALQGYFHLLEKSKRSAQNQKSKTPTLHRY